MTQRVSICFAALFAATTGAQAQDGRKLVTLLGIPSATVAPHGLAFGSLSGTTRRKGADDEDLDGSLALGFGLGSAEDGVGVQFTGYVTSLTDNFGDSGYLAIKASRRVMAGPTPTYVSFGLDEILPWGDSQGQDIRATLAVTHFNSVTLAASGQTYPIMMTVGVGSGVRNDATDPGVFGGVGIGLTENFGTSLAWSGDYMDLGASFTVPGLDNFGFSATVNDIFDTDDSRRVNFSVNYFWKDAFGRGGRP